MQQQRHTTVTEVEFEVTSPGYPFVGVSGDAGCRFDLERIVTLSDDHHLEFFRVTDVPPDRALELVEDGYDVDARLLDRESDSGVLELTVENEDSCIVKTLNREGAIFRTVAAEAGTGRVEAVVLPDREPTEVLDVVADAHPTVELVAKRRREMSADHVANGQFQYALPEVLTDRQREILETAYERGYFEHPREVTGTDLAERLDITQTTFAQHLRAAQRNVFDHLLGSIETAEPRSD